MRIKALGIFVYIEADLFKLISYISIILMINKKIFYRSNQSKLGNFIKHSRANKLSMDDLTPLITRAPSDLKKRNSNDQFDYSKQ